MCGLKKYVVLGFNLVYLYNKGMFVASIQRYDSMRTYQYCV